jgi:hypothetical protein
MFWEIFYWDRKPMVIAKMSVYFKNLSNFYYYNFVPGSDLLKPGHSAGLAEPNK